MTDTAPVNGERVNRVAHAPKGRINVLVLYDEHSSAIRAKAMLEGQMAPFRDNLKLVYDSWRLDVLGLIEVQKLARQAFQTADLVVIATSSRKNPVSDRQMLFIIKSSLEGKTRFEPAFQETRTHHRSSLRTEQM